MDSAVRAMQAGDLAAVERIYRSHTAAPARSGRRPLRARLDAILAGAGAGQTVALVVTGERQRVLGYLGGEVRSWEFGSEPAGWIFALGVDPRALHHGLGRLLLDAAVARFAELGVRTVRTMVRRDDVSVLSFFRSGRFVAGPYVELELPAGGAR